MPTRLSLLAMTALLAGASVPAAAAGISINIGTPAEFVHFDTYRYHHDRAYHDRYDRWHAEQQRREHDRHHDDGHGDHGHDH
ncbi:MAG TPA: hypothetical protein VMA36_07755 [Candidatus Limnocylindria bacterium]|jgi:hypothetical protein|nr:hypothetical protein [Candidatus Limnocylindria bacterium]